MHDVSVILHNIRSAHNVGSVFRTADAAGVSKIYLVGVTPTPVDRFGRPQPEIEKTALGAENSVSWEHIEAIEPLIREIRRSGTKIVAVEQHPRAIDYRRCQPQGSTAFVFGNEVEGLSDEVCADADAVIEIPMHGKKESLNVAVAVGVILFHCAP